MAVVKVSELPQPDIPENALMRDNAHVEGLPTVGLANGGVETRERQPAHFDGTYVSDHRRKEVGVSENEEVCWKLNPAVHDDTVNGLDNWLYAPGSEGRRVVMNPRNPTQPVKNMDAVLCAFPKEELARAEAEARAGQQQFVSDVSYGDVAGIPRWRKHSAEEMEELVEQEQYNNYTAGLIGEFAGMEWQKVLQIKGREWWEQQQRIYRGGPRGFDLEDAEAAADMDEARRVRDRNRNQRNTGNQFISIPQNVRPRNISTRLQKPSDPGRGGARRGG